MSPSTMGCMVRSIFQSTRKKVLCSPLSPHPSLSPTERISLLNLSTKKSCNKNESGRLLYVNRLGIISDGSTPGTSFLPLHHLPPTHPSSRMPALVLNDCNSQSISTNNPEVDYIRKSVHQ